MGLRSQEIARHKETNCVPRMWDHVSAQIMKIRSEDNTVCCTSDKLSHLLSREWQENKQETWEAGKFGSKCKKQVFKISTHPRLSLIKNGKDSMSVKSLDFVMKNPLNEKETTTYKCN